MKILLLAALNPFLWVLLQKHSFELLASLGLLCVLFFSRLSSSRLLTGCALGVVFLLSRNSHSYFTYDAYNLFYVLGLNRVPNDWATPIEIFGLVAFALIDFYSSRKNRSLPKEEGLKRAALLTLTASLLLPGQAPQSSAIALSLLFVLAVRNFSFTKAYFLLSIILASEFYILGILEDRAPEFLSRFNLDPRLGTYSFGTWMFIGKIGVFFLIYKIRNSFSQAYNLSWFKTVFSGIRVPPRLGKKDWVAIAMLTTFSVFFTFSKLGTNEKPKSGLNVPVKANLRFQGQTVQEVWLYKEGSKLAVSAKCQGEEKWQKSEVSSYFSYSWQWRKLLSPCRDTIELSFEFENTTLYEIYLMDPNGKRISPSWNCSINCDTLFDESHLVPEIPSPYDSAYFDEAFHISPAFQIEKKNKVLEVDMSHPFLSKFLISVATRIGGVNPFSWRFADALSGVLVPLLVFVLGWWMCSSKFIGFSAAFFTLVDNGRLCLSRVALSDSQLSFWLVLQIVGLWGVIYYSLSAKASKRLRLLFLLLLGVALGAGGSTKLSGFFLIPVTGIILLTLLVLRKNETRALISQGLVCLVVVPILIFIGCHFALWERMDLYALDNFIEVITHMMTFHLTYTYFHPYQSQFIEWPLVNRPLLIFTTLTGVDKEARIFAFGNPFFWWSIIPSVFYLIQKKFLKKGPILILLMLFLSNLLIWSLVSRPTYIYHFIPIAPIGSVLVAIAANELRIGYRKLVFTFLLLTFFAFLLFLPITYGWPMPSKYFSSIEWFTNWFAVFDFNKTFEWVRD